MIWVNSVTTILLVFITGYYAYVTQKILKEAQKMRVATVRPHIGLKIELESTIMVSMNIHNSGLGPAIDVDLKIIYRDIRGKAVGTYPWRVPLISQNENKRFLIKKDQKILGINEFVSEFEAVEINGKCIDIYGNELTIQQVFSGISEWFEFAKEVHQTVATKPNSESDKILGKISAHLEGIKNNLKKQIS